jgi:hypothetical protein
MFPIKEIRLGHCCHVWRRQKRKVMCPKFYNSDDMINWDWTRIPVSTIDFFFHWLYTPLGPWPLLLSFMIILQTVRLLGRVISSSQGLYLPLPKHRTTQTQNKHMHITNIHAFYGIRTHDPSFQASEYSSFLRPLGYCDRHHRICLIESRVLLVGKYCFAENCTILHIHKRPQVYTV